MWELFLVYLIINSLIGYWLGSKRGRVGDSIALSIFLGPIGWLLILFGPDERTRCPECREVVQPGARRCKHCGVQIERKVDLEQIPEPRRPAKEYELTKLRCPACSGLNAARVWQLSEGLKCSHCGLEFVPNAEREARG